MRNGMRDIKVIHYSGSKGIKPWDFIIDGWERGEAAKQREFIAMNLQSPGGERVGVGSGEGMPSSPRVDKDTFCRTIDEFVYRFVLPEFPNYNVWVRKDPKTWQWHETAIREYNSAGSKVALGGDYCLQL